MRLADNVGRIPPYPFEEIKTRLKRKECIDLSIGDPDLPTPSFVMDALCQAARDPANHRYPSGRGEKEFREAVAEWYKRRFGVDVDPEREVTALIGCKEGIANTMRAFIDPNDRVLIPEPGYPAYNGAVLLCGGNPSPMALSGENGFLPALDSDVEAKLMILNYPNNPTGSVADKDFLAEVVDLAQRNDLLVCYDNVYSEITFDGYEAPSLLQIDGGAEVGIEFYSCSKTFSMTGDRIGFAVGNNGLIEGLGKVKEQTDSGPPIYIQKAAIKALESYSNGTPKFLVKNVGEYRERRDLLVEGLRSLGVECRRPKGTFYVWLKCDRGPGEFATRLFNAGVVVMPGIAFGERGEGYVRFSLTQPKERIEEALERIETVL